MSALVRGWRFCCRHFPQFHCSPRQEPQLGLRQHPLAKSTGFRVLPGLPAAGTFPTREDEGSNCASSQDVGRREGRMG